MLGPWCPALMLHSHVRGRVLVMHCSYLQKPNQQFDDRFKQWAAEQSRLG